jgi:hypothetical protein
MSEDGKPNRVYLGSFTAADVVVIPRAALQAPEQKRDAERARRKAAIVDAEKARARAQNTRRAKMAKRFRQALKMFARLS